MPSRNSIKVYVAGGFYHIYNRGVEKRIIFEDEQDYKVFLKNLKEILSPPDPSAANTIFSLRGQSYKAVKTPLKNYSKEIDLCAYCLMPNHFHLLIKQMKRTSLEGFMRALMTRYSMYFNKRYDRVGSLFQGRYKAVLVENEIYLLHLSKYIHLNPAEYAKDLVNSYSSYADYLKLRQTRWIKPSFVLSFFNQQTLPDFRKFNSYRKFIESDKRDSSLVLGGLTLE
ncbi:MAG: transposase [Candidatus Woesebacteria bacterium]|nr:transposase [Candidatus Woesebacteria bacterium]